MYQKAQIYGKAEHDLRRTIIVTSDEMLDAQTAADEYYRVVPMLAPPSMVERTLTLDEMKAQRWEDCKWNRDRAEQAGCMTIKGVVDTDTVSQRKVSGAVQMAMIATSMGQPFTIGWTMQDNTTIEHSASEMVAMGVAVGQHVDACHRHAVALRELIEAAQDDVQLGAIVLTEGWPHA